MRPRQVYLVMARETGKHPQPSYLARYRMRTSRWKRRGDRTRHRLGSYFQSKVHRTDCGNFPQRTDARRTPPTTGWKNGWTGFLSTDRIYRPPWDYLRKNEDRNSGTYRRTQRALRPNGNARRRMWLPQVLFHEYKYTSFETTPMLDMLYKWRSTSDFTWWIAGLSPFQRTNSKYRPALLPQHRDQDCDFPRQRPASAFPRTGRRNDTGIIPQWILLFASNGYTDCCLEKDSRFQRLGYLSSGICNWIWLLRSNTIKTYAGIESY